MAERAAAGRVATVVLYGLDGCKWNAWVIAESDLEFRRIGFRIQSDLKSLFEAATNGDAILVIDVPIGLAHEARACDEACSSTPPAPACVRVHSAL